MTVNNEFEILLRNLYIKDPCKVLPNALWKTYDRLNNLQCSHTCIDDEILEIKGLEQKGVYILWNKSREVNQSLQLIMEESKFMIIHDDYFKKLDIHDYSQVEPYFRIKHDNKKILPYSLSEDFYIKQANVEEEFSEISDFIGRCYKNLHPSPETVKSWTTYRVFDNSLWIWIMDKQKNIPAALGIAEFDSSVPEGSLEWIQVLPEYQGKGLGKVLVLELLNRLKGRVEFTTVSGEVDNETNPERLYRSCGFYGNDVWWLLRKS
ncbi:hypothetical protein DW1_0807 [Proteiniborus sp. DW1]|uniref:GNAT family N-acetyltransferase n=1 Tax=Proteiniborus sp. DW1 TaxID=1889883 RepID=UPI00092E0843|nr:GNAT family N-acetyltransferase [Proteiniborus sp. DW1]SCG82415.1 hypothetical protein DW1_0807 [Proteiniborus sp. DW1]